jgi:predicted nucleic-acid-binding Zn-ribbon protein
MPEETFTAPHDARCPKCNGHMVVANLRQAEQFDLVRAESALDRATPSARRNYKRIEGTTLFALVCSTCGYTEWYARDPRVLRWKPQ